MKTIRIPKAVLDPDNPLHSKRLKELAEILCEIIVGTTDVFPTEPQREKQTDWQLGTSNNWWFGTRGGLEFPEQYSLRCRYPSPKVHRMMDAAVEVFRYRAGLDSLPKADGSLDKDDRDLRDRVMILFGRMDQCLRVLGMPATDENFDTDKAKSLFDKTFDATDRELLVRALKEDLQVCFSQALWAPLAVGKGKTLEKLVLAFGGSLEGQGE